MSVSSALEQPKEILVPPGLTKEISTASVMDVTLSMNLLTGECDRDPLLKDPITTVIQDVQISTNLLKEVSFFFVRALFYFIVSLWILGSLFPDGSTSGPRPVVENFSSSSSLFGRTSDVVDTADSDGEESYAYSRCSACRSPPTTPTAPSSDRSHVIVERRRQGIVYFDTLPLIHFLIFIFFST